jgi:hypothetical protein
MEGRKVFTKQMNNVSGTVHIPLPELKNGIYILQLKLKDEYANKKIVVQQR